MRKTIALPYPVSANRYWRNMRGRMVRSHEARDYKTHTALVAKTQGMTTAYGDVSVAIMYHPKTTASLQASKKRLDVDNVIKVALDALNGVAYMDDKQVTAIVAVIAEPIKDGGLTVTVETNETRPLIARLCRFLVKVLSRS